MIIRILKAIVYAIERTVRVVFPINVTLYSHVLVARMIDREKQDRISILLVISKTFKCHASS